MENWKTIEDLDAYEVSDLGRVRRIKKSRGATVGKILKPITKKDGYLHLVLSVGDVRHDVALHRIVAEAFIPNPKNLPEVNHLGKKSDCRALRLEWRSIQGHALDKAKRHQQGKGVHFNSRHKCWYATYSPKPNKEVRIGHYATKREALKARKEAVASVPYKL